MLRPRGEAIVKAVAHFNFNKMKFVNCPQDQKKYFL
jgi:hypothetical protein